MGYVTYACRNFYYKKEDLHNEKHVAGYIDVSVYQDKIELNIEYLNHNDYYIDYDQATVLVDYPKDAPIYDVIMKIFDKLTDDHLYILNEIVYDEIQQKYVIECMEYMDILCCDEDFVKLHPEINFNYNTYNGDWIPFTQETSKYLHYETGEFDSEPFKDCIIIYGTVKYNQEGTIPNNGLEFVYDAPIIGKGMSKEYYDITRGRIVWDVAFDEKTNTYYIDPFDPTFKQKLVDEKNGELTTTTK